MIQPTKPRLTPDDVAKVAVLQAEHAKTGRVSDTVSAVIDSIYRSKHWNARTANTRRTWTAALKKIEARWGRVPIAVLADARARPKIVAWHKELSETDARGADIAVAMLSKVFKQAYDDGLTKSFTDLQITRSYERQDRAPVIWLEEDLSAIRQVAGQPLQDALRLAVLTGLRRQDLVSLRWDEVGPDAIERTAAKRSKGKRFRVIIPRLPELNTLLSELESRPRGAGVETVLVTSRGQPWTGDGLNSSFHSARVLANDGQGIWYEERDPSTGERRRVAKRLHDLRGTFATRLMTLHSPSLSDREVATIMGWSEAQVSQIRKRYVDDKAIVMALADRLRSGLL